MLRYLAFVHRMLKEAEPEAPELEANDADINHIIANLLVGPRDVAPLPVDGPQVWLPPLLISPYPIFALTGRQMASSMDYNRSQVYWTSPAVACKHSCDTMYAMGVHLLQQSPLLLSPDKFPQILLQMSR
jgi:hypothetical protein